MSTTIQLRPEGGASWLRDEFTQNLGPMVRAERAAFSVMRLSSSVSILTPCFVGRLGSAFKQGQATSNPLIFEYEDYLADRCIEVFNSQHHTASHYRQSFAQNKFIL